MALGLKDLNITPHPVLPAPDEGMVAAVLAQPGGEEKLAAYLVDREGQIQRERDDPFSFGWEPDNWADADDLVGKFDEVLINGRKNPKCPNLVHSYYEHELGPDAASLGLQVSAVNLESGEKEQDNQHSVFPEKRLWEQYVCGAEWQSGYLP